jgi:RNA polymerase sigma-70 factor (ECF subfamily)
VVDNLNLPGYHLFHSTRAALLERLGRREEAATAYERATSLTEDAAERRYLMRRRAELADHL